MSRTSSPVYHTIVYDPVIGREAREARQAGQSEQEERPPSLIIRSAPFVMRLDTHSL